MKKCNAAALSRVHVATGLFYSRPLPDGSEGNSTVVTGPISRKFPERNWSGTGKVRTPTGLVEDTVPDDQSVVVNTTEGLV
ncbi:MAG TPA: hypothetical protein VMU05_10900, partial [Dongiaceae bacterium]|nr:hypothetical protein [Dongiaceae bacterium]